MLTSNCNANKKIDWRVKKKKIRNRRHARPYYVFYTWYSITLPNVRRRVETYLRFLCGTCGRREWNAFSGHSKIIREDIRQLICAICEVFLHRKNFRQYTANDAIPLGIFFTLLSHRVSSNDRSLTYQMKFGKQLDKYKIIHRKRNPCLK